MPVLGSEVVVHADDTTFLGFDGSVTGNLDGFDVDPAATEARARSPSRRPIAAASRSAVRRRATHRLAILPRGRGGADLVWQVEMFNEPQPGAAAAAGSTSSTPPAAR